MLIFSSTYCLVLNILRSKASNFFNSLLPQTKLVPLSQTLSFGRPLRDAIRKKAFRNESVSGIK